jgi:hypothetical protein
LPDPAIPMLTVLRRHPVLATAFVVALLLALALAASIAWRLLYWEAHENEPVAPWMTVGYIGRSWNLSPRAIDEVAGLPPPEVAGRPLTLQEIARRRGVPVAEVIAEVEAALAELRTREAERRHGEGPEDGPGPGDGARGP